MDKITLPPIGPDLLGCDVCEPETTITFLNGGAISVKWLTEDGMHAEIVVNPRLAYNVNEPSLAGAAVEDRVTMFAEGERILGVYEVDPEYRAFFGAVCMTHRLQDGSGVMEVDTLLMRDTFYDDKTDEDI